MTNLVMGQNPDDTAFTGSGDSGGPVTSLASGGGVTARGINSGVSTGSNLRPCKSYNYTGGTCSWQFYYADFQGARSALGVRILTQ